MKYYVYIVMCKDNTLYTGFTRNVPNRVATHNTGRGAKYTRSRLPVTLVYSREYNDMGDALAAERRIKKLTRAEKLHLINQGL